MALRKTTKPGKSVETLVHDEATRLNIPTAEHQPVMREEEQAPVDVRYRRGVSGLENEKESRNHDLDSQLVWRGKDDKDWSDLVVHAPPLYIQEKVHPKALVDDLMRQSQRGRPDESAEQIDLFADFNGLSEDVDRTDFYRHEGRWTNRMILGDSLQVMASLAEREGLRGKVQCIYVDPPYGIRFNSNFQWSTTNRDVKDGKAEHITREPEQVKAFRDTWRDGIHSYLTYLRDRLTVARELLHESGSIFVQIGDENVHRIRLVLDEVFGEEQFVAEITIQKTGGLVSAGIVRTVDYILWYAKDRSKLKSRSLFRPKEAGDTSLERYDLVSDEFGNTRAISEAERRYGHAKDLRRSQLTSLESDNPKVPFKFQGSIYDQRWKTNQQGFDRLCRASRVRLAGRTLRYLRHVEDFPVIPLTDRWESMQIGTSLIYVVQTASAAVQNCVLLSSDPGDLVLDPTCGSGTTAAVAEQWGRRWITIDTSRVALALARARIMGVRYPYYLLADSPEGQRKEAELSGRAYVEKPTYGNLRHGFVYERVPHITLKSIANNAEVDVIWERWQPRVADALARLNAALRGHETPYKVTTGGRQGKTVQFDAPDGRTFTMPSGEVAPAYELVEWEVPREAPADWPEAAQRPLADFWEARIARQQEIDASIAAKVDYEYLCDKPYEDRSKVRVAGPFTVESLSPHRVLGVDDNDELIDGIGDDEGEYSGERDFVGMILENLKVAGVQQAHKEDRIRFTSLTPWPGELICAEGRYLQGEEESGTEKRAAIFVGPEFGTVSRPDLVAAAREAADAGFDVLIACAFSFEAHASEFNKLGRIPVLKARMNADLHMAGELKSTSKGNLFVIFGEPDIDILDAGDDRIQVKINGVDVFDPNTGEVRSDGPDGIACWFIDTDYNEESFFVRHAYFLGAGDPYKSLKTSLKAEIDEAAWQSLYSDTSRPFSKPASGRIAVKVINHLGDEVMKVFRVS